VYSGWLTLSNVILNQKLLLLPVFMRRKKKRERERERERKGKERKGENERARDNS
jgi:hypothetical protein